MKKKSCIQVLRRKSKFDIISNAAIIVFCLFSIFPIYWLFTGSFKYSTDIVKLPPDWFPSRWTLMNFEHVFTEHPAAQWILNSVLITVLTTAGIILVSSAAGFDLSKMKFPGKKVIFAFVVAALLIPMEIYILPLYKLVVSLGWKGSLLGYIVPNLAMPFGVYLMKNFYDTIPDEIIEATAMDGCSKVRFFFQFGIPLSKPGIGSLAIMAGIRIWNNYLWQLLMATASESSYTLPVGVTKLLDSLVDTDYGLRFAAAALTAVPLLLIFFAFQKLFTEGVSAGAVKG